MTAILRVMGLATEKQFQNYHRVLNRAQWPICCSRTSWRMAERIPLFLSQLVIEDHDVCYAFLLSWLLLTAMIHSA